MYACTFVYENHYAQAQEYHLPFICTCIHMHVCPNNLDLYIYTCQGTSQEAKYKYALVSEFLPRYVCR